MTKHWRRCDWRENDKRCRNQAQGHVGMLHLCKNCFNRKMINTPLPIKALREPVYIRTLVDGEQFGSAVWEPYSL